MKISNHKNFAHLDYVSVTDKKNPYQLGDILTKENNDSDDVLEVGVVIQILERNEVRTDMFGTTWIGDLILSTIEEISQRDNNFKPTKETTLLSKLAETTNDVFRTYFNKNTKDLTINLVGQLSKEDVLSHIFDELSELDIIQVNEIQQNYITMDGFIYEMDDSTISYLLMKKQICLSLIGMVDDLADENFKEWYNSESML